MAIKAPLRILVVEDSTEVRELLVRAFSAAGFEVSETCSVAGAVANIAHSAPDIVITDCFLPDITLGFVPGMKRKCPNMPVIVLSGDPEAARRMLPDADEIVGKPVSLAALIQTVFKFVEAGSSGQETSD
jgi:DNA-binding NtrC family response regulator